MEQHWEYSGHDLSAQKYPEVPRDHSSTLMGEMLPCAEVPEASTATWSFECWSGASKASGGPGWIGGASRLHHGITRCFWHGVMFIMSIMSITTAFLFKQKNLKKAQLHHVSPMETPLNYRNSSWPNRAGPRRAGTMEHRRAATRLKPWTCAKKLSWTADDSSWFRSRGEQLGWDPGGIQVG